MTKAVQVAILVEDPGAANMVVGLPQALSARGVASAVWARGAAAQYLTARETAFEPAPPPQDARRWLTATAARVLVAGTSEDRRGTGLAALDAARQDGVRSVGLVDVGVHLERRFAGETGDAFAFFPDIVALPDAAAAETYRALGAESARLAVTGNPHFDQIRSEIAALNAGDRASLRRRLFPGAGDRLVIVFGAEISDALDPSAVRRRDEWTLSGSGGFDGRTEVVLETLIASVPPARRATLYTVLRMHPKNAKDDFEAFQPWFDTVSQGGASLPVLWAADAVIGMSSMILTEAAFMGRPVLSIVPSVVERNWLPLLAMGLAPVAATEEEAAQRVLALLDGAEPPCRERLDRLHPPGVLGKLAELVRAQVETSR